MFFSFFIENPWCFVIKVCLKAKPKPSVTKKHLEPSVRKKESKKRKESLMKKSSVNKPLLYAFVAVFVVACASGSGSNLECNCVCRDSRKLQLGPYWLDGVNAI